MDDELPEGEVDEWMRQLLPDEQAVAKQLKALALRRCAAKGHTPDHDGVQMAACCGRYLVCADAVSCGPPAAAGEEGHYTCGRCPQGVCRDCGSAVCVRCMPAWSRAHVYCWACRERQQAAAEAAEAARVQALVDARVRAELAKRPAPDDRPAKRRRT
jgi:hypothetical protein